MVDSAVILDAICAKMKEENIQYKPDMAILCIDRYNQQQIVFIDNEELYAWFINVGKEYLDIAKTKDHYITPGVALFFMSIATEDVENKLADLFLWYSVLRTLHTEEYHLDTPPTVFWIKIDTPPSMYGVVDETLWKARFN